MGNIKSWERLLQVISSTPMPEEKNKRLKNYKELPYKKRNNNNKK